MRERANAARPTCRPTHVAIAPASAAICRRHTTSHHILTQLFAPPTNGFNTHVLDIVAQFKATRHNSQRVLVSSCAQTFDQTNNANASFDERPSRGRQQQGEQIPRRRIGTQLNRLALNDDDISIATNNLLHKIEINDKTCTATRARSVIIDMLTSTMSNNAKELEADRERARWRAHRHAPTPTQTPHLPTSAALRSCQTPVQLLIESTSRARRIIFTWRRAALRNAIMASCANCRRWPPLPCANVNQQSHEQTTKRQRVARSETLARAQAAAETPSASEA
jgi:hypothetical protein